MANPQPLKPIDDTTQSKLPLALVGVLVLVLVIVVFVLPKSISNPEKIDAQKASQEIIRNAREPSPLAAAEQRKARSEAQSILKQLLPVRDTLQALSVETWEPTAFAEALASVEMGERLYARGKYDEALASYTNAFNALQNIEQSITNRVESDLELGERALTEADSDAAIAIFERVLLMQPDQAQAVLGLKRAQALPVTLPLWRQVQVDVENAFWANAKHNLEKILEADANFPEAAQTLKTVKSNIQVQSFSSLMSAGFSALAAERLETAESAFRDALKIRPGNEEALSGLAQVETEKINRDISRDLVTAKKYETQENWREAVELYDGILRKHPNIAEVRAAKIPASVRAQLDSKFNNVIREPLKLGDANHYQDALGLLRDLRSIQSPGPKLQGQVEQLEVALRRSQTPVEITLLSDNETNVEIFRVGRFGAITEKTLELRPGQYIAAGNRSGYRDVQIKFTIDGLSPVDPIEVICTEPI